MLGGGVVVLVAVVLWLVYLLPSVHGRHQFNAAERNAVRLQQALRVLAETSETPEEVRLELTARTALAQQRLAKQAQAEREQADLARARAELDVAKLQAKADATAARERAAAEARVARERPEVRRARARRRAQRTAAIAAVATVALATWGAVHWTSTGSAVLLWSAGALGAVCLVILQRMAVVQRRGAVRIAAPVAARQAPAMQDVALASDRSAWTPRELPRPLASSAGSRAAMVLDEADARAALRRARVEEQLRVRAEAQRPASIEAAQAARAARRDAEFAGGPAAGDEAIAAPVRALLARRASGQ